ncbi:MAG: GIY-YIG nuclease family protein, partial [Phycisphaerae bacterium]|nr:GIY-YIG nuclease family protein [Phycisphaerae bacterium]
MAKRNSQLVSQHLENISRKMLEEYQDVIRNFVRKRHGVYALYRRGKLYYVGLASSLLGRLKQHLTNKHGDTWDRFSVYLTIGPAYMKEIESVLIRISDPPGNKQRGKFAKSENLLPKVKAEYRR